MTSLGFGAGLGLAPGGLPPGITFDFAGGMLPAGTSLQRASTATYFDAGGVMRLAPAGTARFDHDPATGVLLGLMIEAEAANLIASASAFNLWSPSVAGAPAPVVAENAATAPDGAYAADRIAYPAVASGGRSVLFKPTPLSGTVQFSLSLWLRGASGGESLRLSLSNGSAAQAVQLALTTGLARHILAGSATFSGNCYPTFGTDLSAGQADRPAQIVDAWGAQLETGSRATSFIPTAGASTGRAADLLTLPLQPGSYRIAYRFDDDSVQRLDTVVGAGGHGVPTNLTRPHIRRITAYPA